MTRFYIKHHLCPVNLNNVVIPEYFYRESSDFIVPKAAGSPTQTFGDDRLNNCLRLLLIQTSCR